MRIPGRPHLLALPASPRPPAVPGLLLGHAALGLVIGWALLAALLMGDVAGLGTLLAHSPEAAVLLPVLALQFGVGFTVFVAATGLFLLQREPAERG
jgi:hypothetical protein